MVSGDVSIDFESFGTEGTGKVIVAGGTSLQRAELRALAVLATLSSRECFAFCYGARDFIPDDGDDRRFFLWPDKITADELKAYKDTSGRDEWVKLYQSRWPDPEQPVINEGETERHQRRQQAKLGWKDRRHESRDAKAAMRDKALAKLAKRRTAT